jgi:hypothetical protein
MEIQTSETFSEVTPRQPVSLTTPEASTSPPVSFPKSKSGIQIPKNPKYRLLISLGVLVFVLLILSVIVPSRKSTSPRTLPTPTLFVQPTAPAVNNIELPSELKNSFTQIESRLNEVIIPALPPEIDLKIGKF